MKYDRSPSMNDWKVVEGKAAVSTGFGGIGMSYSNEGQVTDGTVIPMLRWLRKRLGSSGLS